MRLSIRTKYLFLVIIGLGITACGSDSDSRVGVQSLSTGLKIFATSADHTGDFLNDPLLPGNHAIEKADYFCNQDANKPNGSIYKALLVDGIYRDPVSFTDWVLLPNTTYYRPLGDTEISTTTSSAIFPVLNQDLINSVEIDNWIYPPGSIDPYIWSGISDLDTYATDGARNCNNWTSGMYDQGIYGIGYETTYRAISTVSISIDCSSKLRLYCVEQP